MKKRKNYPKCVPLAKARSMSAGQRRAAVSRKKKAERRSRKGKRPNYENLKRLGRKIQGL